MQCEDPRRLGQLIAKARQIDSPGIGQTIMINAGCVGFS